MRPSTDSVRLMDLLPVKTLRVDVVAGPDQGASQVAEAERLTVGTAPGNDLTLTDPAVSGYHLELERTEEGVRVVDLGSTNGTHLPSARIETAVVRAGTVLGLGNSRLQVAEGDVATIELHEGDAFGELRGRTLVMRRLMARLKQVAPSLATVLLIGESGTGKELIARALHDHSARATGPFVTVDCGALPPTLATTELFGHERGAFTGAHQRRQGAFERAHGGTLFLDEIGELSPELQSHLLGVLDRQRFQRVGGQSELQVDVRVVSATNRDLRAEVNAGTFRLDLYYRLAVVCIEVPALRERAQDVPLLVKHFLHQQQSSLGVSQILPPDRLERLLGHRWPGNVRELRNLVEAAIATGEPLRPSAIPPPGPLPRSAPAASVWDDAEIVRALELPYRQARDELLEQFQKRYLRRLLEHTKGNVSQASREAQMDRSHLIDLLKRHGLR